METIAYHPALATNLHLTFGEKEPPLARFQAIMNALRQLQGHNMLVVDNADHDLEQPDIKDQMPLPPQWQVLVTSRRQLRGYELLPLDRLSPEHAAELFQKHYTGHCPTADLADLLREVDYHTLTVELLAKTLQNHLGSLTLRALTAKLQRRELADPELQRRIALHHSPEETEVYLHLLTTFDCAGLDAGERLLLARCAALPPGGAYSAAQLEDWLQVGVDQAEEVPYLAGPSRRTLHETLDRLDRKGWLTRSLENVFALHRMVQQAVLYQLQPGIGELGVVVKVFYEKIRFDTYTNFTLLFPWIPYIEQLLTTLPESEQSATEVIELINNLGVVCRHLGQYEKSKNLLEKALIANLKRFGHEHPTIAVSQSNLATVYFNLGQYEKARELLENGLAIDLKKFGHEDSTVALSQSTLAVIYEGLNQHEKARDLLENALSISLKNFGSEHANVAICQSNLGKVYRNSGQYEKARDLLKTALATSLKIFGPEHLTVAITQINLGSVFFETGEKEKAQALFQQAYNLFKKQLGEQHLHTQTAKQWLDKV